MKIVRLMIAVAGIAAGALLVIWLNNDRRWLATGFRPPFSGRQEIAIEWIQLK